jgi:hypothetical protein
VVVASHRTLGKKPNEFWKVRDAPGVGHGVILKSFSSEQHPLLISSLLFFLPLAAWTAFCVTKLNAMGSILYLC